MQVFYDDRLGRWRYMNGKFAPNPEDISADPSNWIPNPFLGKQPPKTAKSQPKLNRLSAAPLLFWWFLVGAEKRRVTHKRIIRRSQNYKFAAWADNRTDGDNPLIVGAMTLVLLIAFFGSPFESATTASNNAVTVPGPTGDNTAISSSESVAQGKPATGQVSEPGVSFIKAYESFHAQPYWDYAQWTWGFGTRAPGPAGTISREQADAELRQKISSNYIPGVVKTTPVEKLAQCEFDALVSFNFNTGGYSGSTMARLINEGDKSAAADEFDRWVNAGGRPLAGLKDRRADEKEMFLSCDYERDQ